MRIRARPRGAVEMVDVSADHPAGPLGATLGRRLSRLLEAGESLFVLDLTGTPDLDSTSLGELVACREHVRKRGGVVKLVLTPRQHELFLVSRLDCLFEIFKDEEDALDSFVPQAMTEGIP